MGHPNDDPASEGHTRPGGAQKKPAVGLAGSVGGLASLSRSQPDLSGLDHQQQQQLHLAAGGLLPPSIGEGLLGQHGLLSASGGSGLDFAAAAGGATHPQFNPMGGPSAIAIALQEGDLEKVRRRQPRFAN